MYDVRVVFVFLGTSSVRKERELNVNPNACGVQSTQRITIWPVRHTMHQQPVMTRWWRRQHFMRCIRHHQNIVHAESDKPSFWKAKRSIEMGEPQQSLNQRKSNRLVVLIGCLLGESRATIVLYNCYALHKRNGYFSVFSRDNTDSLKHISTKDTRISFFCLAV